MVPPTCAECGTEMETVEMRQPVGEETTLRRTRSYCPECEPGEDHAVGRSPGVSLVK